MKTRLLFKPFEGSFEDPKLIRIGDFMSYMIMAQHQKTVKQRAIIFSLCEEVHKRLRADIFFKDLFDEVYTDYIPIKETDIIFDSKEEGGFWNRSPKLVKKYGSLVFPSICFDPLYYKGPHLEWGNYVVLNPLFSATYNIKRNMDPNYINKLILKLYKRIGDKLIVITDRPDYITDQFSQVLVSDDLYSLMYIIGKSRVYIGGDTGFTHFAALSRIKTLISLYGTHYPIRLNKRKFNANPMVDRTRTDHHSFILNNHRLKKSQTKQLISIVEESLCQ